LSLSWLVTGTDVGGRQIRATPDLVDRPTALAMYTIAGAQLSGEAELKGTLSVGKYGDFAVLSADYFDVDDARHLTDRVRAHSGRRSRRLVSGGIRRNSATAPIPHPGLEPDHPVRRLLA
jgi:cytosine/adenosine deaminase-related metal-dependent hydrolase